MGKLRLRTMLKFFKKSCRIIRRNLRRLLRIKCKESEVRVQAHAAAAEEGIAEEPRERYKIVTAEERPGLWKDVNDESRLPINPHWPKFIRSDASCCREFYPKVRKTQEFKKFQFVLVERDGNGKESIVAAASSVPFFWPEIAVRTSSGRSFECPEVMGTLPDGGFSTMVARGVRQNLRREGVKPISAELTADQKRDSMIAQSSEKVNALCGLSIAVVPRKSGQGLEEIMIDGMKKIANQAELQAVVLPLRPTKKSNYPRVNIEDYIQWKQSTSTTAAALKAGVMVHRDDPFDPWLRTHVRLGGRVVKGAKSSMVIEADIGTWSKWADIDFPERMNRMKQSDMRIEAETGKLYSEFSFPVGLAPLRVYQGEDRAVYAEPHIWVYHSLNKA